MGIDGQRIDVDSNATDGRPLPGKRIEKLSPAAAQVEQIVESEIPNDVEEKAVRFIAAECRRMLPVVL